MKKYSFIELPDSLRDIQNLHPELRGMIIGYNMKNPDLTLNDIIWNILTDFDDAYNNHKPKPYSEELYLRLTAWIEKIQSDTEKP